MYLIRLDDACPHSNVEKWARMESLLNGHGIKPIVAIIPECHDRMLVDEYDYNAMFWETARKWQSKGWTIALHGYTHAYSKVNARGLNPINRFSEFVGLSYNEQREKIINGFKILTNHGLYPTCFVAPGHSFDYNTVAVVKNETNIRVISDTIANDVYYRYGMFFIPQQCGSFKLLPLKLVTCCYHPNTMEESDFVKLERAIIKYKHKFISFDSIELKKRKFNLLDWALETAYFLKRRIHR